MTDDELIAGFEAATVSASQWTHRAHVRAAYLYLVQFGAAEGLSRFRDTLGRLNAAHGTPDSLDRGYHETMTVAFFRLIAATLVHYGPSTSSDAFCDEHPQLMTKRVLRLFYTRDRIMTWEAKRAFVEPDIAPLPFTNER